jgi:phage baseplate assembly protein V
MNKLNNQPEREAIQALLERVIRVGVVSARYPDKGAVQVDFRDAGPEGTPSWDCPVIQPKTKADKAYWMPDIGERVVVLSLPQGREQGLVVGAFYNDVDDVPVSSNDKAQITFEDGTAVFYDRSANELRVDAVGEIKIFCKGDALVQTESTATIRSEGKALVESNSTAIVRGQSGVKLDGGPGASMDVLVHPKAISDFTGKPIQPPSSTVRASP